MTHREQELLLSVARILRAHLKDHAYHQGFDQAMADHAELDMALKPFDPEPEHGGDFVEEKGNRT